MTLALVATGGALGAAARYIANVAMQRAFGSAFPWHTLAINVLGSAVMGGLMVTLAHRGGQRFAPFLMTGILGGFTTFSAFSMDSVLLWERGQPVQAAAYIGASVLLSLAAFAAAALLMRSILT